MNPGNTVIQVDCNSRPIQGLLNTNWVVTSSAAATTCTATKASAASTIYVITGIFGYADTAAALVTVAQGTTAKAAVHIPAGDFNIKFGSPLILSTGTTANLVVSGATSLCDANMTGFSVV